jgi:tetratricopeptide (TPR) repeat protein
MSRNELDDKKEAVLLEIAGSAYEKAFVLEPDNKSIQYRYSEFLRLTGRQDEVETLFAGKDGILWQFYMRDGRYEKASQILTKLYEQDSKDPTILRGLASVARLTGDKDGVHTYCEQLLDIENTIDNQLFQIEMYLETGLVKEAELKLAAFTERNPQELRGLRLNAWAAMVQGQLDKALALVNRNLEIDGENADAWRLRGNINRLRRDYTQAVADLQKSKSLSPNVMVSLELADAYRRAKRMAAAIGELRSAISDPMAPVRLRTTLEDLYKEAGQKNALRTFYDECIAKYPDLELWYYRAAQFYLSEKDYQKGEELLKQAWTITEKKDEPSASVFDLYLEMLWVQGHYENVLSLASKYIDTPGLGSIAYAQMGQSQAKMGNTKLAMQHYHKALTKCGNNDQLIIGILRSMRRAVGIDEIDKWVASELQVAPDSAIANMVAFHLTQENKQYNEALQHIEKSMVAITPSGAMYTRYSTFKAVTLVKAYLKTSDKNYLLQAIEQYRKILDDQPKNLQALNNLAYLLTDNNEQLDKAEEYGARAHMNAPNEPAFMDTYAYTLCKNSKFTKAEELLQTAIQLYEVQGAPIPWDVYRHLGMAQEGLERNELATVSYQQAIEIGGDTITPEDKDRLTQAIERVSQ